MIFLEPILVLCMLFSDALERDGKMLIGRGSSNLLALNTLGMGTIEDFFHISGTIEFFRQELMRSVILIETGKKNHL